MEILEKRIAEAKAAYKAAFADQQQKYDEIGDGFASMNRWIIASNKASKAEGALEALVALQNELGE